MRLRNNFFKEKLWFYWTLIEVLRLVYVPLNKYLDSVRTSETFFKDM